MLETTNCRCSPLSHLLLLLALAAGCSQSQTPESPPVVKSPAQTQSDTQSNAAQASVTKNEISRIVSMHLPNPIRIHERVISGGLPEGDAAFKELADLGVKTVISVDGMQPDLKTARKHGLRYVHLPHGYDGISDQRAEELTKAVQELDGPIYIHCHHGKHRSPAAASVACVGAGLIPSEQAIFVLEIAGTNRGYQGLFQAARAATVLDADRLSSLHVEFKEVQQIPPMAEAMVQLSHVSEHLTLIAEAGWKSPPSHPDLDPPHEALLLRELFAEMLRSDEVASEPEDFREWLKDSEAAAHELEAALKQWHSSGDATAPTTRFDALAKRISANCKACHVKYRDVPSKP